MIECLLRIYSCFVNLSSDWIVFLLNHLANYDIVALLIMLYAVFLCNFFFIGLICKMQIVFGDHLLLCCFLYNDIQNLCFSVMFL